MEVQYDREAEEVNGVDLQTRRRPSKSHHPNKSNSSTNNSITSESSDTSNFEYSVSMENTTININKRTSNYNNTSTFIITNGEKPKIIEGRSVFEQVLSEAIEEEKANSEEPNVAQNEDTTGFTVHQNGVGVVEYSLPESNGDKETDTESNASSFSKNPETSAGLRFVLDDSSYGDNVESSEFYNGDNMVNKTHVINGQNEIVETGHSQEVKPEIDEYDVERVIRKQETHDLICPNCKSCITKKVILKKRKRKYSNISTNEPNPDKNVPPIHLVTDKRSEAELSPGEGDPPGASFDAISCFSCFSIFIPKGDGFLCWRFKTTPPVTMQQGVSGGPSAGSMDSSAQINEEGTGTVFPMWILTCCQPSHREKPVRKSEPKPSPASENDTEVSSELPLPPTPPSHDTSVHAGSQSPVKAVIPGPELPLSDQPGEETLTPPTPESSVTSDGGKGFPLWILTCCQPSTDKIAPITGTKVPTDEKDSPPPSDDTPVVLKPLTPINPGDGPKTPLTGSQSPPPLSQGTPVTADTQPLVASEGDAGPLLLPKPLPDINPDDGIPSPPDPEAPNTPQKGEDVMLSIPDETPITQSPDIQINISGDRATPDITVSLLPHPTEPLRPGVSGMDIIKAIVYGGLLECITSLSVISSAAGGDATTLNIVALGLANVFGGLLLLLHNLRVLKHEHATERYEDQLGRPGHYMLHAVVAVISYLVFGLMSPIIYGFTFRKSDNKDYKLATLAAASLGCITILSIGKAYVRRPPKAYIQTIFYYISMGFMVSGAGYVAGDLINTLLKKLGVFDSRAPVAMPFLEAGAVKGAWSSY